MLISSKPKIFDVDLFGAGAVLAIVVLSWMLVIDPLDGRLEQQRQQQQQQQQDQESRELELANLQDLTQRREALMVQLSQSQDVLQENTGVPQLVHRLGQLTALRGLQLEEITPGDGMVNHEHFRKISMNLRLTGSFPQLQDFLADISVELSFARLRDLTVSRSKSGSEEGSPSGSSCEILMSLDVFGPR